MHAIERRSVGFVKALVSSGAATRQRDGRFLIVRNGRRLAIPAAAARHLCTSGIVRIEEELMTCCDETRGWLRRALSTGDRAFADQHRTLATDPEGLERNLDESPLRRLSIGPARSAPLEDHLVAAGERFRQIFERSGLRTRVTMSYADNSVASGAGWRDRDIAAMAMDARTELAGIWAALPPECADAIFDICGLEKGLQLVETERGWPRRSAKLVLRIALQQLAAHFGFGAVAEGSARRRTTVWLGEDARPTEFG